jgi:CBS domain-containing protein
VPVFKRHGSRLVVQVKDIMGSPPITVRDGSRLADAVRIMWDKRVGSVLVVNEDGRLVGIITERDVMYAATQGLLCRDSGVSDVMSRNVVTVSPDEDIRDAVEKMRQFNVRHLPVVDKEGRPLGVVSMRDVINAGALFINLLQEPG